VAADLGDLAVGQDHDPVSLGRGGEPVGYHEGGAAGSELLGSPVDLGLGGNVKRGRGLV